MGSGRVGRQPPFSDSVRAFIHLDGRLWREYSIETHPGVVLPLLITADTINFSVSLLEWGAKRLLQ